MSPEFGLGILVALLGILTVVIGSLFAAVAWITVLVALQDGTRSKIPAALYTFTACIPIEIVGYFVDIHIPFDIKQTPMFGVRVTWLVTGFFLAISFICLVSTLVLLPKDAGPGKRTIKIGAYVLLAIAIVGFVSFLAG
jgi:hypothetical protein